MKGGGDITVDGGDIIVSNGQVLVNTATGGITVSGGGSITIATGGSLSVSGSATVGGTISIGGTATVGGTININGTANVGGSISIGGTATVGGSLSVSGTFATSGNTTLGGNLTVSGTAVISGGLLRVGAATGKRIVLGASGLEAYDDSNNRRMLLDIDTATLRVFGAGAINLETGSLIAGGGLAWADNAGLWATDNLGNAAFGVSGVNAHLWGGKSLDKGDVLLGHDTSYLLWDASAGKVILSGELNAGSGIVTINSDGVTISSGQNDQNTLKFWSYTNNYLAGSLQAFEGSFSTQTFLSAYTQAGHKAQAIAYAANTATAVTSTTALKWWTTDRVSGVDYLEKLEFWRTGGIWSTQGAHFTNGATDVSFADRGVVWVDVGLVSGDPLTLPATGGIVSQGNIHSEDSLSVEAVGGSKQFVYLNNTGASGDIMLAMEATNIASGSYFIAAKHFDGTSIYTTRFSVRGDGIIYGIGMGLGDVSAPTRAKLQVVDGTNTYGLRVGQSTSGGANIQGIVTTTTSFARVWFGHNAIWDESDDLWHIDNIGNNDAAGILVTNGGQLEFIVHPGTGATARTFTHANFVAGSKMTLSTAGGLTTQSSVISNSNGVRSLGTNAGITFADRTSAQQWQWYGSSSTAHLYNGSADVFNVGTAGNQQVINTQAWTTGQVNGVQYFGRSSSTPGTGGGVNYLYYLDSDTVADRNAFTLQVQWGVAADATRQGKANFYAYDSASARVFMSGSANGTAATIGFLGAAPAVRQTGGVKTAAATYGANEQSMLQAAYNALRTFGLLT